MGVFSSCFSSLCVLFVFLALHFVDLLRVSMPRRLCTLDHYFGCLQSSFIRFTAFAQRGICSLLFSFFPRKLLVTNMGNLSLLPST